MTIDPLWLQNIDYPARIDRTVFDALFTEGIFSAGSFAVTQSSPSAMTVNVAAGAAVVAGDDQAFQGKYVVRMEVAETGIAIAPAPGTGQRNDLIVLRVRDANAGVGVNNDAILSVVLGTPSLSPSDPTVPDTALVLARVRVPSGTGTITNSLIDDLRVRTNANFDVVPDGSVTSAKITNGTIVDADVNASAAIALTKLGTGTLGSSIKVNAANFPNSVVPSDAVFTIPGDLTTGAKNVRFYFESTRTIANIVTSVGTAPTGASAIFDVNKNGTTIFSTQANRPTIAAGGFYDGSSVPDVTSIAPGDYLTIDVDQIGSSVAGSNAVIRVVFSA